MPRKIKRRPSPTSVQTERVDLREQIATKAVFDQTGHSDIELRTLVKYRRLMALANGFTNHLQQSLLSLWLPRGTREFNRGFHRITELGPWLRVAERRYPSEPRKEECL